jgi:hypothetical protein
MSFYGIKSQSLLSAHRTQKRPDWCWAATISCLYALEGVNLPQRQIVIEQGLNGEANQGGQPENINQYFMKDFRHGNEVFSFFAPRFSGQLPPKQDVINHLSAPRPTVAGFYLLKTGTQHLVVVTGMEIEGDAVKYYETLDPLSPSIMGYEEHEVRIVDFWLVTLLRRVSR